MNDPAKLQWISSLFVSIGTESLCDTNQSHAWRRLCIISLYYSEWIDQYIACALHKSAPAMYSARLRELRAADNRRIIGYFKKRIPCSCLDSSYDAIKHLPKRGLCGNRNCNHVGRRVEINKMWSCEDCRRGHYCSEECQADHWPTHKEECKVWSNWKTHG